MKHHYVPVFYQKYFAASDGLLWVYDRLLKTCKALHPLSICFQHDLYALKAPGKSPDQIVETEFLRNLDGVASSAIRTLPSVLGAPGPELMVAVIYFAALQFLRVPANKEMISMIYESGAKDFVDVAFANTERAKVMIENYETGTGKKLDITPESMVKLAKGGVKIVATDLPFIRNVVEQAGYIARVFGKMDKQVLISPEQSGFILSDNPVTLVHLQGSGPSGFLTPGSYVALLTSSLQP